MKNMMFAMMMSMTTAMMAANANRSTVSNNRNARTEVIHQNNSHSAHCHEYARHHDRHHDCYCRDCQKMRKAYDKHMRKAGRYHNSRHCYECQRYFSYIKRVTRF